MILVVSTAHHRSERRETEAHHRERKNEKPKTRDTVPDPNDEAHKTNAYRTTTNDEQALLDDRFSSPPSTDLVLLCTQEGLQYLEINLPYSDL